MIPEDWRRATLGTITREQKIGTTLRGEDGSASLALLKMGNLLWGGVDLGVVETIGADMISDEDCRVQHGDILFNTRNTPELVGKTAFWRAPFEAAIDNNIMRLRLWDGVDPGYVAAWMGSDLGREAIGAFVCASTSVGAVYWRDLRKLAIPLPPLQEQRDIAAVLSTWDRAIETVEALIANAREQKSVLMQTLLTGRIRLPGFESTWKPVTIGSVCDQVTERAGAATELPVLSCSKHDGFVESLRYFKKKVFGDDLSLYKVVRRGMIGFPTNHVEEGSIARQDIVEAGLVSPIYCVFQPRDVDGEFLIRLLKTEAFTQRFAAATNASVNRRGSLRWKEFSKLHFDLPLPKEQRAIAAVIKDAERTEQMLVAQRDALRKEKAALMQQLLTGKRRLQIQEKAA